MLSLSFLFLCFCGLLPPVFFFFRKALPWQIDWSRYKSLFFHLTLSASSHLTFRCVLFSFPGIICVLSLASNLHAHSHQVLKKENKSQRILACKSFRELPCSSTHIWEFKSMRFYAPDHQLTMHAQNFGCMKSNQIANPSQQDENGLNGHCVCVFIFIIIQILVFSLAIRPHSIFSSLTWTHVDVPSHTHKPNTHIRTHAWRLSSPTPWLAIVPFLHPSLPPSFPWPKGAGDASAGGGGELPGQAGAGHCQTAERGYQRSAGAGPQYHPAAPADPPSARGKHLHSVTAPPRGLEEWWSAHRDTTLHECVECKMGNLGVVGGIGECWLPCSGWSFFWVLYFPLCRVLWLISMRMTCIWVKVSQFQGSLQVTVESSSLMSLLWQFQAADLCEITKWHTCSVFILWV